jgi:hypothetical protein
MMRRLMNNERWGRKPVWLNARYNLNIFLEEIRKTKENLEVTHLWAHF